MTKTVSLTFDDGLIKTAEKVLGLEIPATFYIVSGWVTGEIKIKDPFNVNIEHGKLDDWIGFHKAGLDIGSHSHTHIKNDYRLDLSLQFMKAHFSSPYSLSWPYGEAIDSNLFDSYKSGFIRPYNKINEINLASYNPKWDEISFQEIIDSLPDNYWLIFTFHGINEGWRPITEYFLKEIYNYCIESEIEVKTISKVVNEIHISNHNI